MAGHSANLPVSYRELEVKSKRCCDGVNKTLHIIVNEPSLGLYRIQQHVRKTIPKVTNCSQSVDASQKELNGLVYDTEFSIQAVKDISKSSNTFETIEELLKRASSSAALINMKLKPQRQIDLIRF